MIHAFVHQYQEFHAFRNSIQELSDEDVEQISKQRDVWASATVLRYLHALVNRGGMNISLSKGGHEVSTVPFTPAHLSHAVGCFALVGLSYVHMLEGDYFLALEVLNPLDMPKRSLISRVISCHMVLNYVVGVSYMMLRRTDDAIETFSTVLTLASHINLPPSFMFDSVTRLVASMQVLLAICVSVFPATIDDKLLSVLRELYAEEMIAMVAGSEETLLKMFSAGAPRFITSGEPDYQAKTPNTTDTFELQVRILKVTIITNMLYKPWHSCA